MKKRKFSYIIMATETPNKIFNEDIYDYLTNILHTHMLKYIYIYNEDLLLFGDFIIHVNKPQWGINNSAIFPSFLLGQI